MRFVAHRSLLVTQSGHFRKVTCTLPLHRLQSSGLICLVRAEMIDSTPSRRQLNINAPSGQGIMGAQLLGMERTSLLSAICSLEIFMTFAQRQNHNFTSKLTRAYNHSTGCQNLHPPSTYSRSKAKYPALPPCIYKLSILPLNVPKIDSLTVHFLVFDNLNLSTSPHT